MTIGVPTHSQRPAGTRFCRQIDCAIILFACVMLVAGCATPIGADRVSSRRAYEQVDRNALNAGEPGADALWVIRRYGLEQLAREQPDEAVRQLHVHALRTGDRNILYALAELSFVAGNFVSRSIKAWEPRDARDFYLGAAVYSYLFLFSDEAQGPKASSFDRRFRNACDLYNQGLGLALKERRGTNNVIHLQSGQRLLPIGEIRLDFDHTA